MGRTPSELEVDEADGGAGKMAGVPLKRELQNLFAVESSWPDEEDKKHCDTKLLNGVLCGGGWPAYTIGKSTLSSCSIYQKSAMA